MSFFKNYYAKHFKRKSTSEIIAHIIVSIFCIILALSYVYILVWCFFSSVRPSREITTSPFSFPSSWHFDNFITTFNKFKVEGVDFWGMLINNLYFSVFGGVLSIFFTSLIAYTTTKYKFFGSGIYPKLVFISLILPLYGTGAATYKLFYNLGFINNYKYIFTACGGLTIYYLYFRAFYKTVSQTYTEAAEIDGANDFTIYFRVVLPQAMPLCLSLFILIWVAQWGDGTTPLLYLSKMPTLASGLYLFSKKYTDAASKSMVYCGCFLITIPPLIIFIFCNKLFTANVSIGGIKE